MIVHRICSEMYADDLSGTGAKMYGGRWNSKGVPMLYTAEFISLAALEMLVHNHFKDFSIPLALVKISIPELIDINEITETKLKKSWQEDAGYTMFMGNEFIKSAEQLILKVPSAVITEEFNVLINPLHAAFKKIKILNIKSFRTDKRLFSI
jgi:RES domain-containing protein